MVVGSFMVTLSAMTSVRVKTGYSTLQTARSSSHIILKVHKSEIKKTQLSCKNDAVYDF